MQDGVYFPLSFMFFFSRWVLCLHANSNWASLFVQADDLSWPEAAVAAVTSLEKTAYESLSSDMHKYNIKMRQLEFNLKVALLSL